MAKKEKKMSLTCQEGKINYEEIYQNTLKADSVQQSRWENLKQKTNLKKSRITFQNKRGTRTFPYLLRQSNLQMIQKITLHMTLIIIIKFCISFILEYIKKFTSISSTLQWKNVAAIQPLMIHILVKSINHFCFSYLHCFNFLDIFDQPRSYQICWAYSSLCLTKTYKATW